MPPLCSQWGAPLLGGSHSLEPRKEVWALMGIMNDHYRGYRTIYPPLSNYPGQNRVEIAGSLKLRAFGGADSPKPILKLFSVEIVISSRDDKSRNCWSVEIATKPHLAKSENCQHVEIVVKFSAGALRARVEIARKPTLRRTNSKHFPLLEAL